MRTRLTAVLRRSLVLAAVTAAASISAAAQNITYTFTGTGSGTLGSTSFSNQPFSFTLSTPTSAVGSLPAFAGILASPVGVIEQTMTFSIGALGTGTMSRMYVVTSPLNASKRLQFGFIKPELGTLGSIFSMNNFASVGTWDMKSNLGPLTGSGGGAIEVFGSVIASSLGNLTLSSVSTATFEAKLGSTVPPDAGVVPEPSTYALLATGLFAIGGIARRRRTVAV